MSRSPDDLHPEIRPMFTRFMLECDKQGIEILVTCTYRSDAEQAELYARGRTVPGRKVTNARPGESMHNLTINGHAASRAFDIVPMIHGKPVWDRRALQWAQAGEIGEKLGLEWAGRWTGPMNEFPHFQLRAKGA